MAEPPETHLEPLQHRLERAGARLSKSGRSIGSDEWRAASEDQLKSERELAAAQGLDYAETFDFEFPWDIGAPLPRVVAGTRVFLAFYVNASYQGGSAASDSGGISVTVVTPGTLEGVGGVGVVSCAG